MSISIDQSSPAWKSFFRSEQAKYPHLGRPGGWIDYNGQISGEGPGDSLRSYRREVYQYLRDRSSFIQSLTPAPSQVARPPAAKKTDPSTKSANRRPPTEKSSPSKSAAEVKLQPPRSSPKGQLSGKRQSSKSSSTPHHSNMPRRTRRSQAWKKGGGRKRRGGNKALSSVRVPFKVVMHVNSKASSVETGFWFNHLTIAELAGPSLKIHEEFKVCSIKVRYIPEDITTGSGLYAACLLDQKGFGTPGQSTAVWFPRVADLPGARLCHVTRGCTFTWHPTEPDSRNFRKSDSEYDYVVASFYIFGERTDLPISGRLLITGLLRARGEFYSVNIATRIRELSLLNKPEEEEDCLKSLSTVSD